MKRKFSFLVIIITSIILIITLIINLNKSIKNNEVFKEENQNKNNLISMMIENEEGVYERSTTSEWPQEGYTYNNKLSGCENGSKIIYDEETTSIKLKAVNEEKCYVYFDKVATSAIDKSGNNYYGTFKNGTHIKYDEEGYAGLFFDGKDDYVEIVDLPESIDWISGFTIEFEAKWLGLNYWSRIYDFGNGPGSDNILAAIVESTDSFISSVRYNNIPSEKAVPGVINLNIKDKYKTEYIKNENNYTVNIYKNNKLIDTNMYDSNNFIKNILRTTNYLGKSNWEDVAPDEHFYGYIYNFKITNAKNEVILYYDFSE